ncbi:hypothetical protein JANAI62_23170 [Jannaschia pagri]|uniref:Polyketide cyclase / dehydrase and lipid transport n=1 Tax=Jannaschia pagri TaxID=2829797 RepID=A0ABQ4NMQ2_9RHOB|nr:MULTISPECIES: SRPBCC family protein [unclassified Jannaschia]GIT91860.1 hypothetical protein JANAI61_23180 [Jannaschia sp. AI_61]GIT95694.1 hypothetical protein JANAI62_23170 [Jannaschia sp. AI_62]
MTTLVFRHRFEAPARMVWGICTDFGCLAQVCAPLIRFDDLPAGRVASGQDLTVGVRLVGILPPQPYRMRVVAFDDSAMTLQSEETGAGVRRWAHAITVQPRGAGQCDVTDRLDIDAGLLTPLVATWARIFFRHRHRGRLRLVAEALRSA